MHVGKNACLPICLHFRQRAVGTNISCIHVHRSGQRSRQRKKKSTDIVTGCRAHICIVQYLTIPYDDAPTGQVPPCPERRSHIQALADAADVNTALLKSRQPVKIVGTRPVIHRSSRLVWPAHDYNSSNSVVRTLGQHTSSSITTRAISRPACSTISFCDLIWVLLDHFRANNIVSKYRINVFSFIHYYGINPPIWMEVEWKFIKFIFKSEAINYFQIKLRIFLNVEKFLKSSVRNNCPTYNGSYSPKLFKIVYFMNVHSTENKLRLEVGPSSTQLHSVVRHQ